MAVYTNRAYDPTATAFVRWNTATPDTAGASYPGPDIWGNVSDYTIERVGQTAGVTDHGALLGLSDDDHSIYTLLAGRSGGQALTGGTIAGNTITIRANSADAPGVTDIVFNDGVNFSGHDLDNIDDIDAVSAAFSEDVEIEGNLQVVNTLATGVAALLVATEGDEQSVLRLVTDTSNGGSNAGDTEVHVGDRDPNSNIDGDAGILYVRVDTGNSTVYMKTTASGTLTGWVDLASGIAGNPSGADTEIQFNNAGVFGASSSLVWDGSKVDITGALRASTSLTVLNALNGVAALTVTTGHGDASAVSTITTSGGVGSNGGVVSTYYGTRDPSTLVTATAGSHYYRANGASSTIYVNTDGATAWQDLMAPAGSVASVSSATASILVASPTSGSVILTPQNQEVDTVDGNTFYGQLAGNIGVKTGQFNTGFGGAALASLTTGNQNTAFGLQVGSYVTTGAGNTLIGFEAGAALSTGSNNIAVGNSALEFNTTAANNVAIGYQTNPGTGANNTTVGTIAGTGLTSGAGNVFVGYNSGATQEENGAGTPNTYVGMEAGRYPSGTGANVSGSNAALGYRALRGNYPAGTDVVGNVAVGADSLLTVETGAELNVAIGFQAGTLVSTGTNNILLGSEAGDSITTGTHNICIGNDVQPSVATATYEMNIGDTIFGDLTNLAVRIGGTGAVSQNEALAVVNAVADTVAVMSFESTGSNGAKIAVTAGTRSPNGTVTATVGGLHVQANGASSSLWINTTGTSAGWKKLGNHDIISPTAIASTQTTYSPTGMESADTVRLSASAAYSLNGILAADWLTVPRKRFYNVGSFNITLEHEETVSETTAVNRFLCSTGADIVIAPEEYVEVWYDATTGRARVNAAS